MKNDDEMKLGKRENLEKSSKNPDFGQDNRPRDLNLESHYVL